MSHISIGDFFDTFSNWEVVVSKGNTCYAAHVEPEGEAKDAIESSLSD
ncbi:MAG: hypothetical protein ABFQ95_05475 [Pseudomonadota bacterium]